MRSTLFAIPTLFLIALSSVQVAAGPHAIARRDDSAAAASTTVSTAAASTSSSHNTAQSSDKHATASDTRSPSVSASANSTRTSAGSAAATSVRPTMTASLSNTTYSNSTLMAPEGTLPLKPEVTPAIAVAGVLLMISGIIYCLIGIKNKWIQIFISAGYLTSLAIISLILYVMNPPITNAIQGAYLAAIVAPALLLGTGALVFRDVTEGLGCAVGGFALSMFFLVLKPGGTITSQAGVAILIGCFTAVGFALSFSHYTRSYGIMGASAVGGSTALVLGIDCFSRAGLKEFWIYIWQLNDNIFPLLQATYPITRGIRVEIAGIVIFTFFGILSQLKIWKVIQARREKKEQELAEANKERDEEEAQIGKDVESGNERDRGNWETIYGDKHRTQADSGIGTEEGSTRKNSTSTRTGGETIEMDQLSGMSSPTSGKFKHGEPIIVRVAHDDITPVGDAASYVGTEDASLPSPTFAPKDEIVAKPGAAHTAGPKVVPLPFKLPKAHKADDDVASNATFNDSERSYPRYSQRFSGMNLMRKLSNKSKRMSRASIQTSSSVEGLADHSARSESDRTASVSSRAESPIVDKPTVLAEDRPAGSSQVFMAPSENVASFFDGVFDGKPESPKLQRAASENNSKRMPEEGLDAASVDEKDTTEKTSPPTQSNTVEESSLRTEKPAPVTNLKSHLSQDTSKVVLQYRTNEWAKHLDNADQPEIEAMPAAEPAVEESATVVNARDLLQTPLTAEPKPAPLSTKRSASSLRAPPSRSGSSLSSSPPQSAQGDQQRSSRRVMSNLRTVSSPLYTPIDEDAEASFHAPLPHPADTLLAHRNTLLQNKHLTGSSTPGSRPGSANSVAPFQPRLSHSQSSLSLNSSTSSDPTDDNAPLSLRKSHLQRVASNITLSAQSLSPLPNATAADPALRRETMLAAWRQSIAADVTRSRDPEVEVHLKREEMLAQRRIEQEEIERQKNQAGGWGSDLDGTRSGSRMSNRQSSAAGKRVSGVSGRSGTRESRRMSGREVNNAHREVLRRMQADANKKLMEKGGS